MKKKMRNEICLFIRSKWKTTENGDGEKLGGSSVRSNGLQ